MAIELFDAKKFNAELFGKYVGRIPDVQKAEFLKAGVLVGNTEIAEAFAGQSGANYATIPLYGLLGGDPVNYDGKTNITTDETDTYDWSVITVGRAKGWQEKDFAHDVTGGVDFMDNVAQQVSRYWDLYDQKTMISILKGVFAMGDADFKKAHTTDLTASTGASGQSAGSEVVTATTLNVATQKACGDNASAFSLVIMHSAVATNLGNLNLLEYLKQTDANGIQRSLQLGAWNGKAVIIDDSVPVNGDKYTTYVLGRGAIAYHDVGAMVPYEMDRDPAEKGGVTKLYTRQRKVFAPVGVSYTKKQQASLSPTLAELENGTNWALVSNGSAGKINHRAIALAQIVSKG